MAVLSIPILNPNESNTYRNEAVWNHSAGTISFNNTTGSESISLAHRGGASLVFGNQVTSEFNPNNRQVFTQGDNFTTVQGSNFTLTYTNREDRTFGDHHFITGSPQFLNNILASRYIEVQAEIAAAQSIPENEIPGTGNNSGIELSGPPVDVQALLKEKEAELTQIAQSMGEGGNLHFLSCKHINIVAGTSPANFDSGNFQKAVREVKGGSTYTGIGFAGVVTDAPALVPQFNEVNTASTIPFGDVTVNAATKINLQAGAGGIDIKSAGSMKFAGTGMTVVGGSQVMVTSPGSVYVTSKYTELKSDGNVNIVAPQANIDSKLTVEQDAVMKGKLAVAGDSTVLGNSYVKAGIAAGASIVAGGSMIAAGNMQAGGIVSTPSGNSNNWTNVYTVVQTNSATWDAGGGGPPAPSVDEALTVFRAQSANNISVYSTVNANSGSWMPENNAAVNTVVITNSANWSNAYTTVNTNSATFVIGVTNDSPTQGSILITTAGDPVGEAFTLTNLGTGGSPFFNNLTVSNTISSNNVIYAFGGNSNLWNSTYATVSSLSANNILDGGNTKGANIIIGTRDNFNLNLETADTTRMTVTSAGNVGIGTATPAYKLAVDGGVYISAGNSLNLDTASSGIKTITASGNDVIVGGAHTIATYGLWARGTRSTGIDATGAGSDLQLITAGTEKVRIQTLGNVGIGTTTPNARLTVAGVISSTNIVYASGGNSDLWNSTYATVSSLSANYILAGGNTKGANIVIGTNDNFDLNLETNGTTRMTIASSGLVSIDSISVSQGIGSNNTTNIAVGGGLTFNTTGAGNTSMGKDALSANTAGNLNTALGRYSLIRNKTGSSNVALGSGALSFNTSGNQNTSVGDTTLQSNTTGNDNTAVGHGALQQIVGSSNANTAIGQAPLNGLTTGGNNIGIGKLAGFNTNDDDSDGGLVINSICNNSIFIGNDTRPLTNDNINVIVIGNSVIGTGSNTTNINNTNTEYTLINGTANHRLQVANGIEAGIYSRTVPKLFGDLPAASTAGNGARAYITNSTLAYNGTNIGTAVSGTGSNHTPVIAVNGVWVIGG